jgi:hypothetical protein
MRNSEQKKLASTETGDAAAMHKCQQQKRSFCMHHIARIDLFVCQKLRPGSLVSAITILHRGQLSSMQTAGAHELPSRIIAPEQSAEAKYDIANVMLRIPTHHACSAV